MIRPDNFQIDLKRRELQRLQYEIQLYENTNKLITSAENQQGKYVKLAVYDPTSTTFAKCVLSFTNFENGRNSIEDVQNLRFSEIITGGTCTPLSQFTETEYDLVLGRRAQQITGIVAAFKFRPIDYISTATKNPPTRWDEGRDSYTCNVNIPVRFV